MLLAANVDFAIVGGIAGNIRGNARVTFDLDIVYERSPENIGRLVQALRPLHPYLRGAPPGLPFVFDEATVRQGLNFTLSTDLGDLDLLGEITGGGSYDQLRPYTDHVELLGIPCRCVTLDALIRLKRAAGRPKDIEAIAELEALREERDKQT